MTTCVIPARGGSQRIPRKNIKMFHGKPIILYSIETAQRSGMFDEIVVSTDDVEIFEIARNAEATAYMRLPRLAEDNIGTQEVAQDVLKQVSGEFACVLYATAPLLTEEDLRRGFGYLKTSRSLDYAYSTDLDGNDAGCFYWGKREAFVEGRPLNENYITVPLSDDRVCDINTMEDWNKAMEMFEVLNHVK